MSTQDLALPQGFTQEQMDMIKTRWGQIGSSDPQQFMKEMTQYGVGTQTAARALGQSTDQFGQWQLANGAAAGFGGYDPSKQTSEAYRTPEQLNYYGMDEGYYNPQAQWDAAAQSAQANPNVVVGGTPAGQTAMQGLGARPANTEAQNAAMGVQGSGVTPMPQWNPVGTEGGLGSKSAQDPWAPPTGAIHVNTGVNPAWSQPQQQQSPTWTNGYQAPAWAAPGGNTDKTYSSSGALGNAFGSPSGSNQPAGGALTQFLTTPHP